MIPILRTMTVKDSEDVLLENIFVSSRSSNGNPARNTDGADTIAANRITFRGWEVDNGDDSIGTNKLFPGSIITPVNSS